MTYSLQVPTFVLSLLLFCHSLASAQVSNPAVLNAFLSEAVDNTKIPGVVALAVDKNQVIYRGVFGHRDVAAGEPMMSDTIFNLASMTKPVAATAIMMLVEEGKLALDDPISAYLPTLGGREVIDAFDQSDGSYSTRPAVREITIRHLLSHSSGLAYGFASHVIAQISGGSGTANDLPLLHDPGDGWTYAGGIGLVATLLERIEGQGLDSFIEQRIFAPLGMHDTSYIVPADKHARVVTVHASTDDGLTESPRPVDVRSPVSGDGGLYGTASDYAKFIQLFLNEGVAPDGTRLLSTESIRLMGQNQLGGVTVRSQDEPFPNRARSFPLGAGRDGFGLGFQITAGPADTGMRTPGSMSWAGIFNTEFWIDPATGIGAVLLMQYLPFYDEDALDTLVGFETRLYEGL
ncbi:MAG: serine hydrolase domain-containing protein [Acidobacteriota bacterium]|nr:serine hydrolase domain-containing protein [Acidobacteriota bacterium]